MLKRTIFISSCLLIAGCANTESFPSIEMAAPPPQPINVSQGHALPHVPFGTGNSSKVVRRVSGTLSPKTSGVWETTSSDLATYLIPVGIGDPDTFNPGSMTLLTFDCPVMGTAVPNDAFSISDFGATATIAAKEGAPPGIKMRVAVQACGINHKIIATTTNGLGLAEAKFKNEDRKERPDFGRLCSDQNFKIDKIVEGGPLSACTVLDARGGGTATYFTLNRVTQQFPSISTGNGVERTPARFTKERLPNGDHLFRLQTSVKQIILDYPNKERVVITRGE